MEQVLTKKQLKAVKARVKNKKVTVKVKGLANIGEIRAAIDLHRL